MKLFLLKKTSQNHQFKIQNSPMQIIVDVLAMAFLEWNVKPQKSVFMVNGYVKSVFIVNGYVIRILIVKTLDKRTDQMNVIVIVSLFCK